MDKILDLEVICKERQEFDVVVTALKGSVASMKGDLVPRQSDCWPIASCF